MNGCNELLSSDCLQGINKPPPCTSSVAFKIELAHVLLRTPIITAGSVAELRTNDFCANNGARVCVHLCAFLNNLYFLAVKVQFILVQSVKEKICDVSLLGAVCLTCHISFVNDFICLSGLIRWDCALTYKPVVLGLAWAKKDIAPCEVDDSLAQRGCSNCSNICCPIEIHCKRPTVESKIGLWSVC